MSKSLRLLYLFIISSLLIFFSFVAIKKYAIPLYKSFGNTAQVERLLSAKLEQPVHIGHLETHWQGLQPFVVIDDFSIRDNKGVTKLHINRLKVGINLFATLIKWRITPGELNIEGTQLLLREKPNGVININDIPALEAQLYTKNSEKLAYLIDCFLTSGKKNLKNIDITWYDQKGNIILPITELSLTEKSHSLTRNFSGNAKLWNQSLLSFKGNAYGSFLVKSLIYSKTNLFIQNLPLQNNSLLDRIVHSVKFRQGIGQIDTNFIIRGKKSIALEGSLQAKNVQMEKNQSEKLYPISSVSTHFSLQHREGSLSLLMNQLQLKIANQLLPVHELNYQQTMNNKVTTQVLSLDVLPINEVAKFIIDNQLAPVQAIEALSQLKPFGQITKFELRKEAGSEKDFILHGNLKEVSFLPWNHYPGIQHLNGTLNVSPRRGSFSFNSMRIPTFSAGPESHIIFRYKPMFRYDIAIEKITGQINWWQDSFQNWQIKIKNFNLDTKEGSAVGYMNLFIPKNHTSPEIQSKFNFNVYDASQIAKYLPVTVIPRDVVKWLDRAIRGGIVHNGVFQLNGSMKDFPFDQGKGKFLIMGELEKGILHYQDGWPQVNHLRAKLHFEGRSMVITSTHAATLGAKISYAKAKIANLDKAILSLKGQVTSLPNQDIVIDRNQNPLAKLIANKMDSMHIKGKWQLGLNLLLPLDKDIKSKAKFNSLVKLDNIAIDVPQLVLKNVTGDLVFNEDSAESKQISGKLFNKPFRLTIARSESTQGKLTHFNLDAGIAISDMSSFLNKKLLNSVRGTTTFQAKLNLLIPKLGISNISLAVVSNLLGIESILPTPFNKIANSTMSTNLQLRFENNIEKLAFNYGGIANGLLNYKKNNNKFEFENGNINIDSAPLKGRIEIPSNFPSIPLKVIMVSLDLTGNKSLKNDLLPDDVPSMDLSILNLRYKDKAIKNIALKLRPDGNTLFIKQAQIKEDSLMVSATGFWRVVNGHHETLLNGSFDSNNLGGVLNQWQVSDNVVKGQGKAQFDLKWPSSPFNLESKTMSGSMNLHFNKGRITKLSGKANFGMDMGRMLTLFSLQTLQRRLMLDFSDLTQPGYSFDEMKGLLQFKEGNIFTENTSIDGPVAKIRIKGRIGLAKKDYNLNLTINPYVTSSLPIVATLTAGPIVGAATWLADKVLSRQVKKMTEIHYNVTGSWTNPNLKNLTETSN